MGDDALHGKRRTNPRQSPPVAGLQTAQRGGPHRLHEVHRALTLAHRLQHARLPARLASESRRGGEIVARLDGRDARKRLASELEERFRKTRQWEIDGDRRFQRHPLISVYYEDLVQDPHRSLAGMLDFLDLRDFPLQTALRKQNPGRLVDLMTNYHGLKEAFAGTAWESFFDE